MRVIILLKENLQLHTPCYLQDWPCCSWTKVSQTKKISRREVWSRKCDDTSPAHRDSWNGCCVCQETYRAVTPARVPDQTDSITQALPFLVLKGCNQTHPETITITAFADHKNIFHSETQRYDDTLCCCEMQAGESVQEPCCYTANNDM